MKRFRKILLTLLAAGTLLGLGAGAWLYWQQDRLAQMVVKGLNQRLAAPVAVQDIGLSLQRFPAVSIRLSEVFSAGNPAAQSDTLLSAQAIYLEMDLWKLFTGPVEVQRMALEKGTLLLKTNARGESNYRIWKEEATSEEAAQFSLKALEIKDMRTIFHHVPGHFRTVARISKAELRGNFSQDGFDLMTALNAELQAVQQGGQDYLRLPQKLETLLSIEQKGKKLQVKSQVFRLPGLGQGQLQYDQQGQAQHLELKVPHLSVGSAWQWLQGQKYLPALPMNIEGSLALQFNWKQKGELPAVTHLAYGPDKPLQLRSKRYGNYGPLHLKGRYHRSAGRDTLWVEQLRQEDKQAPLRFSGRVVNLRKPALKGHLKADWPLRKWAQLLPGDSLEVEQGRALVELRMNGRYPSWQALQEPQRLAQARLHGSVELQEGRVRMPALNWLLERINGKVIFDGEKVKIERLFAAKAESDIFLRGRLGNVLGYLLFPEEPLQVDARLKAQRLVVEDFLDQSTGGDGRLAQPLEYTRRLQLKLNLAVDELQYASFTGRDVAGKLQIANSQIQAQNLRMNADGGRYQGQMRLTMPPEGPYQLQAEVNLEDLQLRAVFESFQNFGQQTLTARHLTGQAWLAGDLQAQVAPSLQIRLPSLRMTGTMRLENGRLQKFQPMLALSDYAALEALQDVRFDRLENDIRIEKEWIHIPKMHISSNVMDLDLQGRHSFDNQIDYLLRIKLGKVLFSRRKPSQMDPALSRHLAVTEERKDHLIPVAISGSVDQPQVHLDKSALTRDFKEGLKRQGTELRDIFKKEKRDTAQGTGLIFEWKNP
ncbi:MAG: AsmA-like C-terminal region-containing protein [Schleiferiaceae bacterium]|nr:AsmA-like C-terminal region-containing protein [Schleiferiaceae bacterium]